MKIKIVVLTALLAFSSIGFAQPRKREITPSDIVKGLYAAHKSGASPFFQTKNRALVDKYFRKDLADLIWKDAVSAKGEAGAINFDPLYGSQDPQITNFIIMDTGWGGDSKYGPANEAVVQVTFKDAGKERMVSYQFKQGRDKVWKIYDVHYRNADGQIKLAELLAGASAASQTSSGQSEVQQIQGELQVGRTQSLILYFGPESGDYASYCFANNSRAGRAILAACKNRQRCEAWATVSEYTCKIPNFETDVSFSGKIERVRSVKSLGRRR
jgi:hypothetical protein